ncbi:MAG: GumC family protein [Candidatus Nitrosoglobus sp.]
MNSAIASSISLRDLLQVIFKRKFQILIFFFTVVGLGTLLSLIAKPQYEAEAKLLVNVGRENFYTPEVPINDQRNAVFVPNKEEEINSEIEILKSHYLIKRMVEVLGPTHIYPALREADDKHGQQEIVNEAVRKIRDESLQVEKVPQSNVIKVSFRHQDPILAAKVVNTLVDLYLERHMDLHQNLESSDFYQTQAQLLREKLAQGEASLQALMKQYGISAPAKERELLLQRIGELEAKLFQTLTGEAETEKRINELRRQLAQVPRTINLYKEIDNSLPVVSSLETKMVELKIKEQELLARYKEESRVIGDIREQIQTVAEKLAEQKGRLNSRSRTGVNPIYQVLLEGLSRAETKLKGLKAAEVSQATHLKEYKKRLSDLNRIEMEFNNLQQRIKIDRQNYQLYLTRFEESRISKAMNVEKISNVSLIDPGKPPLDPISPKILLNIVLSILVGGIGSLVMAFLWQYLDDKLEQESDIEKFLGLPVLASIPERG